MPILRSESQQFNPYTPIRQTGQADKAEIVYALRNEIRYKEKTKMTVYLCSYKSKGKQRIIALYSVWRTMRQRCCNPNHIGYKYYGGRGITVCEQWEDYSVFRLWAINTGYRKGLTIDRADNDGNYGPDNCRWCDYFEQNNNRRSNVRITYGGLTLNKSQWAKKLGLSKVTMWARFSKMSVERAIELPVSTKWQK